jgi:hypothetical protein
MRRPTWTLCAAAVLTGVIAGAVAYSSTSANSPAPASSVTGISDFAGLEQLEPPRASPSIQGIVSANWNIGAWLGKSNLLESIAEAQRLLIATAVGVIVGTAVLVVGMIIVPAWAAVTLALVAGIVAGFITYYLLGRSKNDEAPKPPTTPIPGSPSPIIPPKLPENVFLRVRWEPEPPKTGHAKAKALGQASPDSGPQAGPKPRNQAKHLTVHLDWRSKSSQGQTKPVKVEGRDTQEWESKLKEELSAIKSDVSPDDVMKNRVKLDTLPNPGEAALNTVRKLIRQVFGEWVVIEEGPPEQGKPQGQNPN